MRRVGCLAAELAAVLLAVWSTASAAAAEPPIREWDQDKAVAKVSELIDLEKTGQPWDKIAWETDAEKAAARAVKEDKPMFVYFYLKKSVGPAAAPC